MQQKDNKDFIWRMLSFSLFVLSIFPHSSMKISNQWLKYVQLQSYWSLAYKSAYV